MPTIKIHNCETNEVIEREMTAAEIAQKNKDEAFALAEKQAELAAIAKREALLSRLGITEEEAKLLLS